MPNVGPGQTAKISSLDAARAIYFIVAALAVRQALLFLRGGDFNIVWRFVITFAFLFTAFRFSHGIAVVYELEKKAAETYTAPTSKKVERVFAFLSLEAIFLFLMSDSMAHPAVLTWSTVALLWSDLGYIAVSKTIRDASFLRLLNPVFIIRRWKQTIKATAPRTHLQWAISDEILSVLILVTLAPRVRWTMRLTTGDTAQDWSLAISVLLILAGLADYWVNGPFYFGGVAAHRGRKCVFVCSPLKPQGNLTMAANIRRAQWYCRQIYLDGGGIPFAPHAFYPYFLDDSNPLDRILARRCSLEFLAQCDAIYVFGSESEVRSSQGMTEELRFARVRGLEIKFKRAEEPPEEFNPVWNNQTFPEGKRVGDVDLEKSWKKVFVCSRLRPKSGERPVVTLEQNIRVAQWLCHELARSSPSEGYVVAPFAPHAFYPYFTDYDETSGVRWLESGLEILQISDAVYVYTEDGMENETYISAGMRQCVDRARELGIEVEFRQLPPGPPETWQPTRWQPAYAQQQANTPNPSSASAASPAR